MTKYIEYFQVEAKCLLKDFKKNLPEAKSRCEKYFNGRDSLSLMNAQHVVAKEYGFESWNDLISQESHKLAEALIVAKNKTLKNPFKLWHGGRITTGYEENKYKLHKPEDYQLEYDAKKKRFIRSRSEYLSFEHLDVSNYDLSGIDPLKIRYSEDTKWPENKSMLPEGFNPKTFLEERKNPGLGIKSLHKQGIKGQGRSIAIIGNSRLFNHIEYHNSLKGYEEIGFDPTDYGGGADGRIVSLLVGKTCGIVPSAEAYFYAVNTSNQENFYVNYAKAIQNICELHKKLKNEGKTGIDMIFIGRVISDNRDSDKKGFNECQQALKELENLNIYTEKEFCEQQNDNNKFYSARIYCRLGGNIDNPDDYEITDLNVVKSTTSGKLLFFPSGGKTVALDVKMDEYAFDHKVSSHTGAYQVGLFLLAKSIKETITPYEFFELGLKTGDFREGIGTIINPTRLIESIK